MQRSRSEGAAKDVLVRQTYAAEQPAKRISTWLTTPPKDENASMLIARCASPAWLKLLVSIVMLRGCSGGSASAR